MSGTDGVFAGLVPHAAKVTSVAATILLVAALLTVVLVSTVGVPSAYATATG